MQHGYTVKRATISGGPYSIVAKDLKSPAYVDKDVQPGKLYYYVVSASNAAGIGEDTLQSGASAGLPGPWAQKDVGSVKVPGFTLFDGSTFTLEAAGTDIGGDCRPVSIRLLAHKRRWHDHRAIRSPSSFPIRQDGPDDARDARRRFRLMLRC